MDQPQAAFTKEDADSFADKLEAWLPELTPGEQAVLGAVMTPAAVEGDETRGFMLDYGPRDADKYHFCICLKIGGFRIRNPFCPVHSPGSDWPRA